MPETPIVSAPAAGMDIITKAAEVVDAIALHGELSAGALAQLLDEPTSSIYRLLANLRELGWVESGSVRGTHRLGLTVIRLGAQFESQLDLRRIAMPELQHLHDVTQQTAFLCVRRGDSATCIERVEGRDVHIQRLRIGDSRKLHEGAAPKTLLALQPQVFIDGYLQRLAAQGTSASSETATDADTAALAKSLADIRADGYALVEEPDATGITSAGCPVFDQHGTAVASISISGIRHLLFDGSCEPVPLVQQAARRISEALGYDAKHDGERR